MQALPFLTHRFDDRIVNITIASERAYWCKQFGCTEMQLYAAVASVGTQAADVEKHVKGLAY
jgi:hypothetical protein